MVVLWVRFSRILLFRDDTEITFADEKLHCLAFLPNKPAWVGSGGYG